MPNRAKLTKRLIDSLEPKNKDYIIWDEIIKGFAIKVTPMGRKTYFLKYTNLEKQQRKPSIGTHGSITCEQARKIASDWYFRAKQGEDPSQEKKSIPRNYLNVREYCNKYMKEYVEIYKKPSSVYNEGLNIKNHILPNIGDIKLVDLCKQDILALLSSMRSTPVMANHIRASLSKMLNLAEEWGLRPEGSNPVKYIKSFPSKSKERFLNQQELVRLNNAINESAETPHVKALFKLLMLTGARLREIMHAKWEWVDFDRKILNLPDSKTGKKPIRLSDQAIHILKDLPRINDNPYIIIGKNAGEPLKEPKKQWKRICQAANLEDVRIHDLRHTFASKCVENGIPLQVVGKLLGHSNIRTTERYAHLVEDHIRQATENVGAKFAEFMEES